MGIDVTINTIGEVPARIRGGKSTDYDIVGTIPHGTLINVDENYYTDIGDLTKWIRINYNGLIGFVRGDLTKLVNVIPPVETNPDYENNDEIIEVGGIEYIDFDLHLIMMSDLKASYENIDKENIELIEVISFIKGKLERIRNIVEY